MDGERLLKHQSDRINPERYYYLHIHRICISYAIYTDTHTALPYRTVVRLRRGSVYYVVTTPRVQYERVLLPSTVGVTVREYPRGVREFECVGIIYVRSFVLLLAMTFG